MTQKKETGAKGEKMALNHLQENGYVLIDKNVRHKHSEIDLIVMKKNLLVFVEVKTRLSTDFGYPEEFITLEQINSIYYGAMTYCGKMDWEGMIRFDIIAVELENGKPIITHFQDAF